MKWKEGREGGSEKGRKGEKRRCTGKEGGKERKMIKKKISQFENSGGSVQSDSGSISPGELPNIFFTTPSAVRGFQPIEIQQVIVSE